MEIRKRYSDKVQIIYKHFNRGDYDKVYANAVECAGEQGKFWEMYNALFDQRDENVAISANKIGVNIAVFNQCVASKKYDKKIRKDTEDGNTLGVRGTPSFLINKKLIVGFRPIEGFEKLIREELK